MSSVDSKWLSRLISRNIFSKQLENICKCSLDIVSNASSHQIKAAIDYNQHEINTLLIQLLTINFIKKNTKIIENETKQLDTTCNTEKVKTYCSKKLLEISPNCGFSPKAYFLEYNVSDDIRMEILTYLKPLELFKSITILNKQFHKSVCSIHESTNKKYKKIFATKNFTFDSFLEMEEYCTNTKRKALRDGVVYVDWISMSGLCEFGRVTNIDNYNQYISAGTDTTGNQNYCSFVAPHKSLTFRPCNKKHFVNMILKRGHYNETCDINISRFSFYTTNNQNKTVSFDISRGITNDEMKPADNWICGKIDFYSTLNNSLVRLGEQKGILITRDDIFNENENAINRLLGNDISLSIFQIGVEVDITKYYNQYNDMERAKMHSMFTTHLMTLDGRNVLILFVHGDDASVFSYFGDKSHMNDRKELMESVFCNFVVGEAKKRFLDLIGYPNYCVITPLGEPICLLQNEEKFNLWCHRLKQCDLKPILASGDVINHTIDRKKLENIHYDEEKDELHVKILYHQKEVVIFIDSDAPPPLKSTYRVTLGSDARPRLIDAIITEPEVIDIDIDIDGDGDANGYSGGDSGCDDDDVKSLKKKDIYFERLQKWKGVVRCSFDITDVFNEFQERLKNEWEWHKKNSNVCNISDDEWKFQDNRKYFTNANGNDMEYLTWDHETNTIKCDFYLGFNSNTVEYDFQFNLWDRLGMHLMNILFQVFSFIHNDDQHILRGVCHQWDAILNLLIDS